MKKKLALLLTMALGVSLIAGCGGGGGEATSSASSGGAAVSSAASSSTAESSAASAASESAASSAASEAAPSGDPIEVDAPYTEFNDFKVEDEDGVIKIGLMEDISGPFVFNGSPKIRVYEYMEKIITESGGIGGLPVEFIKVDIEGDTTKCQEMARYLILEENCDVLICGTGSDGREAMRPIVEENGAILFFDQQYEGGEASHNVFVTGPTPEQQVTPMVDYMVENFGKKFYVIASDYNFGQITTQWFQTELEKVGGEMVGNELIAQDSTQFASVISNVQAANADVIVALVPGTAQMGFLEQWAATGADTPKCSTINVVDHHDHLLYDPPVLTNLYVTAPYIEELDTEDAKAFTKIMRDFAPDEAYYTMDSASSYITFYFYIEALKAAGTTEKEAVIDALEQGITMHHMPSGTVTLNGDTHHVTQDINLFRVNEEHFPEVVEKYDQIVPNWLSDTMGIDLRKEAPNVQLSPLDS